MLPSAPGRKDMNLTNNANISHFPLIALPDSFAFLAHSEMSSWERPSVKTRPILGMFWERGRAPSASEKLCSTMCLRARPVMVPFSMYCTLWTASLTSSAVVNLLSGNSVRTRLEYWTSPTWVPWGDTSRKSTIWLTNCFTSSKFWGRTLLEPSMTITKSMCPALHSIAQGKKKKRLRWGSFDFDFKERKRKERQVPVSLGTLGRYCSCLL